MSVKLTNGVSVVIRNDVELVRAFLSWQLEQRVYSLDVGGMSGGGRYVGTFDIKHRPAIAQFFRDQRRTGRVPA